MVVYGLGKWYAEKKSGIAESRLPFVSTAMENNREGLKLVSK